jgi:hypothetical protein
MNEIPRLSHEGDAFERELLASARADRMSERGRRALLAAVSVGAAGIAGSAATKTIAATASVHRGVVVRAVGSGMAKWIGWGLVGSLLALAGARAMTQHHPGPPSPPTASALAEVRQQPDGSPHDVGLPAALPSRAIEGAPASAPTQRAAEPVARSLPLRARSAVAPASAASAHDDLTDAASLSAELMLIETARTALREGRARDALAALEEHRSRFARGAFTEEAAVLRIEALAKVGESATASRLARSFLDTRPRSPYASRVRRALAAVDAGELR